MVLFWLELQARWKTPNSDAKFDYRISPHLHGPLTLNLFSFMPLKTYVLTTSDGLGFFHDSAVNQR